jgi:hypothetical protein
MRSCDCPKCEADISDSYEPDDPSVGVLGGWYCNACDLAIGDDGDYEPFGDEVSIAAPPREPGERVGTPISELSGRPGHPGFAEFCRIAKSWGYD